MMSQPNTATCVGTPLMEHLEDVVVFVVIFVLVVGVADIPLTTSGSTGFFLCSFFLLLAVQEAADFVVVVVLSVMGTKEEQKAEAFSAISKALPTATSSRTSSSCVDES